PPEKVTSALSRRYFTPSVHSTNFELMPSRPATIIQKVAPGPPMLMAIATPAMLPSPTVPDSAVASAWKWVTSPGWSGREKSPRIRRKPCAKPRRLMKRKYRVKASAATSSHSTTKGMLAPKPIGTGWNTSHDTASATGAKALLIAWSRPPGAGGAAVAAAGTMRPARAAEAVPVALMPAVRGTHSAAAAAPGCGWFRNGCGSRGWSSPGLAAARDGWRTLPKRPCDHKRTKGPCNPWIRLDCRASSPSAMQHARARDGHGAGRRLRAPCAVEAGAGRHRGAVLPPAGKPGRPVPAQPAGRPLHLIGLAGRPFGHARAADPPPQARHLGPAGRARRRRPRPVRGGAARGRRGIGPGGAAGGAGHLRSGPALDPGAQGRARPLALRRALRGPRRCGRGLRGQRGVARAGVTLDPRDRGRCRRGCVAPADGA